MSDIQLSGELMHDVQDAVRKHAPDADMGEVMQYLAAVMGYMLGNHTSDLAVKSDYMEQLNGFARQVMEESHERVQQHQKAAAPRPASNDEAFGYWTPSR